MKESRSTVKKTRIKWYDEPQKQTIPRAIVLEPHRRTENRETSRGKIAACSDLRVRGQDIFRARNCHCSAAATAREPLSRLIILKQEISPVLCAGRGAREIDYCDGYHAVRVYSFDEDAMIRVKSFEHEAAMKNSVCTLIHQRVTPSARGCESV